MALWGCFKTCINLVPFHNLWIDGDETEKRSPCTLLCVIVSLQEIESYETFEKRPLLSNLCVMLKF
jgi:hypothetical protein